MYKDKYFEAVCVLSELLLEVKNESDYKRHLLNDRDKEIERLKAKIENLTAKDENK